MRSQCVLRNCTSTGSSKQEIESTIQNRPNNHAEPLFWPHFLPPLFDFALCNLTLAVQAGPLLRGLTKLVWFSKVRDPLKTKRIKAQRVCSTPNYMYIYIYQSSHGRPLLSEALLLLPSSRPVGSQPRQRGFASQVPFAATLAPSSAQLS